MKCEVYPDWGPTDGEWKRDREEEERIKKGDVVEVAPNDLI